MKKSAAAAAAAPKAVPAPTPKVVEYCLDVDVEFVGCQ